MTVIERKEKRLQKFNLIFGLILIVFLFLIVNSNLLFAQNFKEAGLNDPSLAGISTNVGYRIYQSSQNMVKFEIPEASYVTISVYDDKNNVVRNYIYNNLKAGTYEINLASGNLNKGIYTCVLNTSGHQESTKIAID